MGNTLPPITVHNTSIQGVSMPSIEYIHPKAGLSSQLRTIQFTFFPFLKPNGKTQALETW